MDNLTSVFIAILVITAVYSIFFSGGTATAAIPLSQLASDIEAGTVQSVTVQGDQLAIVYTNGTKKIAKKEAENGLTTTLSNYGVTPAEMAKVSPSTSKTRAGSSSGSSLSGSDRPPAHPHRRLSYLVLLATSARCGDAGVRFGQSKPRLIDPARLHSGSPLKTSRAPKRPKRSSWRLSTS